MIDCAEIRLALSARLDGEPAQIPDDVVDAHMEGCAECREFYERAAQLNRSLTLVPQSQALEVPDLSANILDSVSPAFDRQAARRARGVVVARCVLVACGVLYVWLGVRAVALSGVDTATQQLSLDAAAVRMTLAFGALFAAWQPRVMASLMPVYGALCAFTLGLRLRDVVLGQVSAPQVWWLVLLAVTAVTMAAGWWGRSGFVWVAQTWRGLNAAPRV